MKVFEQGKEFAARALQYLEKRKLIPETIYRRVKNYSLAGKINFIIVAATVPMLLLLALLFLFLYIQLKSQLDLTLVQKMIATRNAYNYYERTTLVYAKMLAENPYIKKELLVEAINVGPILRVCNQVQSSVYLNRITVHDRRGFVVVRSHKTSSFGEDESKQPQIERALQKGENTALLVLDGEHLVLQNTVPVYLEGETVGAITAGYILNDDFARSIANLTQTGILFVLNGKVISPSYPGFFKNGNALEYPEENRTWSETRSVKTTAPSGKKTTSLSLDTRYLPMVTERASPAITRAGIVIAVNPPFSRLFLYLLIWGSFTFSLGVVLFGILLALKIGHNIANYATEISGAMTVYAQGNLSQRMQRPSADELGRVAHGFNLLAEELQKKIGEIQEANETLELKVHERTKDLNLALADITSLKETQEGDYLLTDLLIRPLSGRSLNIEKVHAEFVIDQKKKYNFRGRHGDIGGDYCLLAPLRFEQHEGEWLFFFNGDAMGKSTQGASGALICGVTLHSILSRHAKKATIAIEPQQYLTLVYRELNDIFSLFDSSMLMSAACGLIHAGSGTMYYFNCEHPWTVLLREGKAMFIEDELTMRKLGMPMQAKKLSLRRLNLIQGDCLILGSDGRDDLEINAQIDSDEFRFLAAVERANGQLAEIVSILDSKGKRTDDLSLMQIQML
jgi:HAMP domain-containing protein